MTVVTVIILHNTYIREYFEGGEIATEGEASAEDEASTEEDEVPAEEGVSTSQMNRVDLEDTINKSPHVATMEASGQHGGQGQINQHETDEPEKKEEAVSVDTSPLTANGDQNGV